MFQTEACASIIKQNPRSQSISEKDKIKKFVFFRYRYGTSGFRGHHETLDSVMVRVGFLAALRSLSQKGQAIGIMVTASHNDECDNGVKIIDPSGEMMDSSWEGLATDIANQSEDEVLAFLQSKYDELVEESKNDDDTIIPTVFIGRDTRPHSPRFAQLVAKAATSINCKVRIRDFGEITTPQLHYIVMRGNGSIGIDNVTADLYLSEVLASYRKLIELISKYRPKDDNQNNEQKQNEAKEKPLGSLTLDCANGVGGIPFKIVQSELVDLMDLNLVHLPSPKFKVNAQCGAEHVHKKRSLPRGLKGKENAIRNQRIASLDGDCDRLMYYMVDGGNGDKLEVLDGDKQICLLYQFMRPYIAKCKECGVDLTLGVVQTGYANGASTSFIEKKLGIKTTITPTGVKHLHHEAKRYDLSIYFEANGHGTILISRTAIEKLNAALNGKGLSGDQKDAIEFLKLMHLVSNQAIGDALADCLLIEAALYGLNTNMKKWSGIYQDRPSCLTKLKVKDRTAFKTANAEQTCVEPKGVQEQIDAICAKYKDARSFVRPSGTEDCVRVYAEATTQEHANEINLLVQRAVYDIAGGVGDRP